LSLHYSIVNILSFTLNVDYDLCIQYAGYSPAIPRNLLSRSIIQIILIILIEEGITIIIEGLPRFLDKVGNYIQNILSLYRPNNSVTY
jgi:hypothetical protein